MKRIFDQPGDFEACRAAEDWCKAHGIAVGAMERGRPRGLLFGDCGIAKWHNLSQAHRDSLDGTMTGDMRSGPVVVSINAAAALKWLPEERTE